MGLLAACSSPADSSPDDPSPADDDANAVRLLAQKSIDLTGYTPPSTSSGAASPVTPSHTVEIVPSASGWVRIRLSALGWVSADGVKQNWSVLVGDQKILRSDMSVIGTRSPQFVTYEIVTDMAGQSAKLEPGVPITLTWGWSVSGSGGSGTAFFDNSVSTMTVEAVPAPADVSVAPGATLPELTTPENVASVAGRGDSQTASWADAPEEGDLLLALFVADAEAGSFAPPDGWNLAKSIRIGTTGTRFSALYWKSAGADEPEDVTFSAAGAEVSAVHLWSKRGFASAPEVVDSTATSLDASSTGTNLEADDVASPRTYAVAWLVAGGPIAIEGVANGFTPVFADSDATLSVAAAEKTLFVAAKPRLNVALPEAVPVGVGLVMFSGL